MDAKHKTHITKLESRVPRTPPEGCEAQAVELHGYATTIETCLAETHKLLDEATDTWTTIEDIDGLIEVGEALQKNQKELDELMATMKDLVSIQRMLKMGESKKFTD